MNEIPTHVYDCLLSMSGDDFQREYRYIRCFTDAPETVVEYESPLGWFQPDLSFPYREDIYQTTADEAMGVMEEAKRLREL